MIVWTIPPESQFKKDLVNLSLKMLLEVFKVKNYKQDSSHM